MRQFLFVLFFCQSVSLYSQNNSVALILQKMFDGADNLRSAKFTLYTEERMKNGNFIKGQRFVKFKVKPKQVYFYSVKPNPGMEILWKEGWNDDKMMVGPGSFPFISFSMKPNNSIARKDSHHSIRDVGFEYMTDLVKYYLKFYGKKFYNYLELSDSVQWDNHSCYFLSFNFKDYAIVNYKVGKGETIYSISKKFHLNDYSILMVNPGINDFDDKVEGKIIKIPNFYARKIEFYIDRVSGLPLRQLIYDQNGLYEKYEMKSFILNPTFKQDEFSPDFEGYKF